MRQKTFISQYTHDYDVVYCNNQDELEKLSNHSGGDISIDWWWCNEGDREFGDDVGEGICINICDEQWCSTKYAIEQNYKIVSFQDFIKNN